MPADIICPRWSAQPKVSLGVTFLCVCLLACPALSQEEPTVMPWLVPPGIASWSAEAEISKNGARIGRYTVSVTGSGASRKTQTNSIGAAPWFASFDLGLGSILENPDDFITEDRSQRSGLNALTIKSRDLPELRGTLHSDPATGALVKARLDSSGEELLTVEVEYDEVSGFRVPAAISGTLRLSDGSSCEYRVSLGSHRIAGEGRQGAYGSSSGSGSSESFGWSGRSERKSGSSGRGDSKIGSAAEKLFKRALTYLDNGAPDLALEAYTQAAVADPEVLSRESRGLRETLRGRCERILKVNVTNVESYYILGAISAHEGASSQARSYLQTAAKLDSAGNYRSRIESLLAMSGPGPARQNTDTPGENPEQTGSLGSAGGAGPVSGTGGPMFVVSGKIDGNSYARVTLESYGGDFKRSSEALEGSFRFQNIPPGIYRVYPEVGEKRVEPDGTVVVTDGIVSYESQEIEVLDGDLEGLTLYRSQ